MTDVLHATWGFVIDGGLSADRWTQVDFVEAWLVAAWGIVLCGITFVSNRDAGRKLAAAKDRLPEDRYRRYHVNILMRWATSYFIFTGEGWWIYRGWGLWHYTWTLPHEVLFFDLFRLSGFAALSYFWRLASKA